MRDKRQCLHSYLSQCSIIGREMAECPPFQSMPEVASVCQSPPPPSSSPPPSPSSSPPPSPSSSPPPPSAANIVFPMPGQPIFGPLPVPFGYPPMTWSPFLYPPPLPLQPPPIYDRHTEDVDVGYSGDDVSQLIVHQQQSAEYVNYDSAGDFFNEPFRPSFQHRPPPKYRSICHPRNTSNKFDTKHEEFRKYLEEMGILSTFTNIIAEMYQDPLRLNNPLEYIRNKLNCSRPETVELSNLRLWCEQYQMKIKSLEKELKHVIERLRKYEPYTTDNSLFNEILTNTPCKSCELEETKQGHVLTQKEENANYETINNNN